jgi:GNAT superfamily N-acetyltransferase
MALWRVRATVDDRPGFLAVLAASLALRSVNILSVQVHASESGAIDDFLVDAPDSLGEADLIAAVLKGRGREAWVSRTDAYGLVDAPTHLLGLAARVIREPRELDLVLASLMGDCTVRWRPDEGPTWQGFTDAAMALPDPSGGTLYVDRDAPPFTPAEYARASALVDLASTVAGRVTNRWQVLLPGGDEVTLRLAAEDDLDEVLALHERCSPSTRRGRYLSGTTGPARAQLDRLLSTGYALVALDEPGRVVALANLVWEGPEAEVGLLVEDAWQRRGLGTALLRRAVRLASAAGIEVVHTHAHADNNAAVRTLRRLGRPMKHVTDGALVTLSLDLREPVPVEPVTAQSGTPSPAQ